MVIVINSIVAALLAVLCVALMANCIKDFITKKWQNALVYAVLFVFILGSVLVTIIQHEQIKSERNSSKIDN